MNDPQPVANNENNAQQPDNNNNIAPPPARRNIYSFGPVRLQWEDFLSSLDELSHINRLPKTGQPLDIVSLGCSTISKGKDLPGRIVTIDVEMVNLQPIIERKIRLVEKLLRVCSTFLKQDPEGVASQVFDICANALIEIYQSNSHIIQTLQPFYWRELLSAIKYSVDENKELGAGMRLGLCNIIADLEESEQSSKSKLHVEDALMLYLREVTSNEREQIELMQKIALLLCPDEASAADSALMEALRERPPHRYYEVNELARLFESMFEEVSVALIDGALDVLVALSRHTTCSLDLVEITTIIKKEILSGLHEESDRVLVFTKLMELIRVLVICNMPPSRITEVLERLVPTSVRALESMKVADFSQKTICKMIELYCLAAERDLDLTAVTNEIMPNIITIVSKFQDRDAVLKEVFNYASYALCSKSPINFLKSGLESVMFFVRKGLGEQFVNDSEMICLCLELASLFVRQKAEPQGLLSFFEIQMPSSFEALAQWDWYVHLKSLVLELTATNRCSDNHEAKQMMLLDVLRQGLIVIQNGINRYKYFIFYMPPIYTMIEQLPIEYFLKKTGDPADKNHVHQRRMELLRETVQILTEEVKKGNDISILLSDAMPMVFELYGKYKYMHELNAPTEETTQGSEGQTVESTSEANTASPTPAKRSLRTAQRVPVEGDAKTGTVRDPTQEIMNRLRFVITKYESNNDYALLLLLKSCFDFSLRNFKFFDPRKIGEVFRNLLDKGQRDHLKGFIRICNSELNDVKYQSIRNYIFGDAGLSARNFEELCKVLAMIFDLRKFKNEAVDKIIVRIVASLEECLINNSFTVEVAKDLNDQINRLILFKNLFGDELEKNKDKTAEELNAVFQSKFPQDMVQDEGMMNLLTSLSLRIERITFALPKWKHVADFTVDLLNQFFALDLPDDPSLATNDAKLKYRREQLDKIVYQLPKNHEMRKYLSALGYSESLWEKDVWLEVEVDDRKNIDENFKASLIGIYGEYIDMYKNLYPTSEKINIDGRDIELDQVFADDRENMTVDDLKSRRNVLLKAIDKRVKNHPRKSFIVNRKLSLLTREDQLEADVEQQKLQEKLEPAQKRRYWCRFNNTFLNSANCCGKNIVGCYAPDGDHAEKPIENSLKSNLGFISVYDTDSAVPMTHEIENAEVLFTDQGLFVYKIYTNGHSYDTSLVWASMFKALIEAGLVPAIIIPRGFPNNRTFSLFEAMIPTELVGGLITYKDDFFEEAGVESYFDFKAAKIQPGDVILTDKNIQWLKLPDLSVAQAQNKGKTLLRRSAGSMAVTKDNKTKPKAFNAIRKDLAGIIMTRVILKLKSDSNAQLSGTQFFSLAWSRTDAQTDNVEAFARFLSQYITLYTEHGIRDFEVLTVGFDLDQWSKRKKGKKKDKKPLSKEDKENLIKKILAIIHSEIESMFDSPLKLKALFARNKEQFFELQQHLLQVIKNLHRDLATVKAEIQQLRLAQQRQRNVMQQGANNDVQPGGESNHQSGPEIKADNKETAQIIITAEEIKIEQEKAQRALRDIKNVLRQSTVTVRISDLRPQLQIFAMKWIFGNEDRVWRDRGGRPGEETLQSFFNFVTVPQPGSRPVPSMNTASSTSVTQVVPETPPASLEDEDEDDEPKDELSRSEMRLDHYGNAPFGGFIEFTRKSLPPKDDKSKDVDQESLAHFGFTGLNVYELDTLEHVDIAGYCIGDYIERDNFEVVTAWVHPAYRSIGMAWKLYEITIEEIHRRGGKFMTYDILQGSLERVIRSSPVLTVCRVLGITDLCVTKRRKSYANQTSMGTEEQFERIRANVKWILMGKKALEAKRKAEQFVQKLKFWQLNHVPRNDAYEGILSVV